MGQDITRHVLVLRVDVTHMSREERENLTYALSAQCEGEDCEHGHYPPAPGCTIAIEVPSDSASRIVSDDDVDHDAPDHDSDACAVCEEQRSDEAIEQRDAEERGRS